MSYSPLWHNDVVVWSETAIPYIYENASPVVNYLSSQASTNSAALVTGIFGQSDEGVHNSIISLGDGHGIYHKQRLVPFGEYVPLRAVFPPCCRFLICPCLP